jgi:hypothetical protein
MKQARDNPANSEAKEVVKGVNCFIYSTHGE